MKFNLVLRYTARAWSIASGLLLCAFIFGGREGMRPTAMEMLGLLFFPVGLVVGFIISWRREATGAVVSLGSLAALFAWMFVRDGRLPGLPVWFLVFAGPAFLFLASALLSPRSPKPIPAIPAA